MRFSPLHFLLLGATFAAPIQDVEKSSKRSCSDGLLARGLLALLPRSPLPVFVPPPRVPTAPRPPPPAGRPVPHDGPPPPISPHPDAPEAPALPGVRPNDPEAPPPRDVDDVDGGSSCGLNGKRCAKRPDPPELEVGPKTRWKQNKVEVNRKKGYHSKMDLDERISSQTPDKGWKGDLAANNRYATSQTKGTPQAPYLETQAFKDLGLNLKPEGNWKQSTVANNEAQMQKFQNWRDNEVTPEMAKHFEQRKKDSPDYVKPVDEFLKEEFKPEMTMLRTLEDPSQGAMIIKESFNKKNDLYRPYDFRYEGKTFTRPGWGDKKQSVGWTDQTMANWRKACEAAGVDVKSLKWMVRDNIVTADTQKTFEGVLGVMKHDKKENDGKWLTIRREGGSTDETASFDAIAGTVHGQRPIQMLADHRVELGDKKVKAFHIVREPGAVPHYHMVIEFE